MAKFEMGGLNEGSLVRRTLLHVAAFVLGSLAMVGLMSFSLVAVTRAVLPSHGADAAETSAADGESDGSADAARSAAPAKAAPKTSRSKRARGLPAEAEASRTAGRDG